MKTAIAIGFVCLGVLSGCTILRTEEAQEGVPRARLRVITDGVSREDVEGFPRSTCWRRLYWAGNSGVGKIIEPGFLRPKDGNWNSRSLGMPDPERITGSRFAEIYVEANKPFALRYWFHGGTSYCGVAAWFVPEENKDYEFSAKVDYKLRRCAIFLSARTEEGRWVPAPMSNAGRCPLWESSSETQP